MDYCFICGVSEEKARLFDAISDEGISKICERCSFDEGIPLIKRPTTFQLKESEKPRGSVYERMKKVSGFRNGTERDNKTFSVEKKDTTLRDIVDKNYRKNIPERKPRTDLVDNFHWIIMTERRRKKLSQKQLAEQIGESESAIKLAEQGILPNDEDKLIKKLEAFLEIIIIKRKKIQERIVTEKEGRAEISFEPLPPKDKELKKELTIAVLQEMKKKEEEEFMNKNSWDEEELNEGVGEDEPEFLEKKKIKDLTDDEIRRLIFKR